MHPVARAPADHRLGFHTLDRAASLDTLPVRGSLPSWLAGTLLRNGPARFEVGARGYRHWFDGLAMLHRFSIADGKVSYANRYLASKAQRAATETGAISYSEFATDPCRSLFQRVTTLFAPPRFGDNASVSVVRLGEQFLAMTETPLPVAFDPATLTTVGVGPPAPGQLTVAHPHRSRGSGELVSYATHFGPLTTYRVYAQPPESKRRMIARLAVSRPAYMHSFAITEHYVVLVEFPFLVVPVAIPLSGRPFIENYHWHPRRGTRFQVIDLTTGKQVGSYRGEPLFAFHHVNAFERDRDLAIDLCAYPDAEIVHALYLERLRQPTPRLPQPKLRRCHVHLDTGQVHSEPLADIPIELPRIDYERCNGRPYRYVYGVGLSRPETFLDQIVKIDVNDGAVTTWSQPGAYAGEPVFVPAPDARGEDDGVLLSVVLDAETATSFLLVLDAHELTELARATVPHHIPFGFHGNFNHDLPRKAP
jgi:carotenoid cleavage dioxygenase-like enzyme